VLALIETRVRSVTLPNVKPTVLVVDDHEGFRTFVRTLLSADGFEVAGEAADGEQALEMVGAINPDLVLLDVQLPGIDGFEVAARLASRPNHPAVVMTSSRDASEYGARLERAPVRGFVPKHELSGAALIPLLP
jgi:DNA-binding NarL/FixJ family response regulator